MRSICPVVKRVEETPSTVTLTFDYETRTSPGQFVMLWIPGDDEIPMSLSYVGAPKGVTVKVMGATSRHIQDLRPGELIGVRGPYGNTFDLSPRRILIVAGGSGAAVLAPAAEAAIAGGSKVSVALGATVAAELLFARRFEGMGAHVHIATDDGSLGAKGYVTALLPKILAEGRFDAVWTCGPEVMMTKVIAAARPLDVPVYCSVERQMKCALGLCDACALGPLHVCIDGPVFSGERLAAIPEFGHSKRDSSGRRVPH
ncbi:MAG: dihydroorotate dehydrogenase electron transfer subunit [Thermoplasmata archaeon]|nr:dihydroorotate dehydrogenase electron transfer subunit [Thermoplasmata archaeon]